MNILYITDLRGNNSAGPTYSVPEQINAQSKIDNVFWYNLRHSKQNWKKFDYYYEANDNKFISLKELPEPFNNPDLIVVEQFYDFTFKKIQFEILMSNIPYIIIPRGELTYFAQKRKRIKKFLANMFISKKFAKKAVAIQYLTNQEYKDSGDKWNKNKVIIPNGITAPLEIKNSFSKNKIQCVSIGRIEPYQKGLDLLLEACKINRDFFLQKNCIFSIYGPDRYNKLDELKGFVNKNKLENIVHFYGPVYGKDKERVMLESDVYVMPSRFEGHPMALIEALSFGLPCVVTEGSNMSKEVSDFEAGWIAYTDSKSLAKALVKMIDSYDEINDKSINAIELAKKYQWNKIASESHNIYLSLCKNKKF